MERGATPVNFTATGGPRTARGRREAAKRERLESLGLLTAPLGTESAVYDLTTHEVTVLHPLAGLVLETEPQDWNGLIGALYESAPGATREGLAEQIQSAADELAAAGLLREPREVTSDDPTPVAPAVQAGDSAGGAHTGATFTLVDTRVAVRGDDADLVARVDGLVGLHRTERDPDVFIDVWREADGSVRIEAPGVARHRAASAAELAAHLPRVIAELTLATAAVLVVHGGTVRTPTGVILALPGTPGSGTSTLTAALVQAGCDLIGDSTIALRADSRYLVGVPQPIVLDPTGLELLGIDPPADTATGRAATAGGRRAVPAGRLRADAETLEGNNVGPVDGVVVTTFDPEAGGVEVIPSATAADALEALAPTAANLDRSRTAGWRTLCKLCSEVPVVQVRHNDAVAAAARILGP